MRQFQRQTVPPVENRSVHPIVRFIWRKINEDLWSQEDVAKRSGVSSSCMRKWRRGERNPQIRELEAVVNTLGYRIVLKDEVDVEDY